MKSNSIADKLKVAALSGLLIGNSVQADADVKVAAANSQQPVATAQQHVSPHFKQGSLEQKFTDFEPDKSLYDNGKKFAEKAKAHAKAGNYWPVKKYRGAPPLAPHVPGFKGQGSFDLDEFAAYTKFVAEKGDPLAGDKNIVVPRLFIGVFMPPGTTVGEWDQRLTDAQRIAAQSVIKFGASHGASVWEIFPIVDGQKIYSQFLGGDALLYAPNDKGELKGVYIVSLANRIYYGTDKTPQDVLPNTPYELSLVLDKIFEGDEHILTREELVAANCKRDKICPTSPKAGGNIKVTQARKTDSDTSSGSGGGGDTAGTLAVDLGL